MNQDLTNILSRLGISLLLGMLIGFQSQKTDAVLAGIRTFCLVTIAGTISALLDSSYEAHGWLIGIALISIALMIIIGELRLDKKDGNIGMTTAVTLIVTFFVGAYLSKGDISIAVATGVCIAALLHFKFELNFIAQKLGSKDMRAIIQFAVLSCVVLPVLPNENIGPLEILNPFNIWLMVVLIVGIGLAGYIAYKFFGHSSGLVVGGLLGGAVSSTATSVSYSRRAKNSPAMIGAVAAVISIASSVVFIRIIIELLIVAPNHFIQISPPIFIMLISSIIASIIAWTKYKNKKEDLPELTNPSEIRSAIFFGILYALVLYFLALAKKHYGTKTLYLIAILSGLTDMDAITLSTGRLVEQSSGAIEIEIAWKLLIVAAISNLFSKSIIVFTIAGRALFLKVFYLFLLPILTGLLLVFLY